MPKLVVREVCDGLGTGTGMISRRSRESQAGNEGLGRLTDHALQNPRLLVAIDSTDDGVPLTDDGCGDGRPVAVGDDAIVAGLGSEQKTFKRSLNRAKVFGGGAAMAMAARIGLGKTAQETLKVAFTGAIDLLTERHVEYGAHTDTVASEPDGGCGSIDKAPAILQAIKNNQTYIVNTIAALGIDTKGLETTAVNGREIVGILDNFAIAADADNTGYSGREIVDTILERGKVVKRLAGEHREIRIVLNFVPDHTVDQAFVRRQTDDRGQVFAVDAWRLLQLAEELYDDPEDQRRALLSELVYTLGTAAVLTDGTLPVYAVTMQPDAPNDAPTDTPA